MKSRPILFSAPMVRALLDGSKTQTRRVAPITDLNIKPHSDDLVTWGVSFSKPVKGVLGSHSGGKFSDDQARRIIASMFCPYGQPGDQLWVRETWMPVEHDVQPYRYRSTNPSYVGKWRPSIFMPRDASRITLELTGVRVERLQDISANDAMAEGIQCQGNDVIGRSWLDYGSKHPGGTWFPEGDSGTPILSYRTLWESINGAGSWKKNPWVWCLEFRQVQP